MPSTSRAPVSSVIRIAASAWPSIPCSGWSPFSNRVDASERRPSRVDVRWMFGPFQVAASISTRVVESRTSERSPPMIPAIDVGPSSSQMITMSASNVRSTSSSVVIVSPSSARRTTSRPPATRSKSNACIGWPVASITKFVMSTTLLIGRIPAAVRRAFSHSGDGPILTSSYSRAVKRGHSSASWTSIAHAGDVAAAWPGSLVHGGGVSGAPVAAWTSRATP